MAMGHSKEKVSVLAQVLFDSADDCGSIGVSDLLGNHSDGVGPFITQRAGKKVRFVVQLSGSRVDSILRFLRDRTSRRSIIEDCGNGARRQPDMLGNGFERHYPSFGFSVRSHVLSDDHLPAALLRTASNHDDSVSVDGHMLHLNETKAGSKKSCIGVPFAVRL